MTHILTHLRTKSYQYFQKKNQEKEKKYNLAYALLFLGVFLLWEFSRSNVFYNKLSWVNQTIAEIADLSGRLSLLA